jgi:hypothetical protein
MAGIDVPHHPAGGIVLTYVNVDGNTRGNAQMFPAREWQKQIFYEANDKTLYIQPNIPSKFSEGLDIYPTHAPERCTGLSYKIGGKNYLLANMKWSVKRADDDDFTTWRVAAPSFNTGWSHKGGVKYFDKVLIDVTHGTSTCMTWLPTQFAYFLPSINVHTIQNAYMRSRKVTSDSEVQWPPMEATPTREIVIPAPYAGTRAELSAFLF